VVNLADPDFLGTKFGAAMDLFVLGVPFTDTLYRDGEEVAAEEVEERQASVDIELGRLIGNFTKVNLEYDVRYSDFGRADDTAEDFVIPEDHYTHSLGLQLTYTRSGYRFRADGRYSSRSRWEPWGLPGSDDFDPDTKEFVTWGVSLAKTFHLPRFRKFGVQLEYVDGSDLDRFSKYQFGFFSDIRVHGYQSEKVRAEKAAALHLSYGLEVGEFFRLQGIGDVAWATDEASGLDQELLAGLGVAGTVIGPWQSLVRLDVGVPVAGPDDGFTLFLTFLKLFK
jgi:hypothetical protein